MACTSRLANPKKADRKAKKKAAFDQWDAFAEDLWEQFENKLRAKHLDITKFTKELHIWEKCTYCLQQQARFLKVKLTTQGAVEVLYTIPTAESSWEEFKWHEMIIKFKPCKGAYPLCAVRWESSYFKGPKFTACQAHRLCMRVCRLLKLPWRPRTMHHK